MVNSNLKLLQLRFMIYHLWLILGVIMVKIISLLCQTPKGYDNSWKGFTSDIPPLSFNTFGFPELFPLGVLNTPLSQFKV
jgi:hypothetical protein